MREHHELRGADGVLAGDVFRTEHGNRMTGCKARPAGKEHKEESVVLVITDEKTYLLAR